MGERRRRSGFVAVTVVAFLVVFSAGVAHAVLGSLTFSELERDGVGGVDGLDGASEPLVSPDGAHVYVATQAPDNAVATFSRDASTGGLTFVEVDKDGDGGMVDGLDDARELAISPEGAHVYVASGGTDNGVATFSRNPSTGALTFVEVDEDGVGLVDGLNSASDVAVSPDGAHVYATGNLDDAVATFSRNPSTGALTFVEQDRDGDGGVVDGLNGASGVAISPDGVHVYVSSDADDAVATFSRDPSGMLTFVEQDKDGVAGVDGLNGASAVAISPDGAHVYAVSDSDDAVATFARDPSTGALTFVEQDKDGMEGVDGLDFAQAVTTSPDSAHVYATGFGDDAVATFSRDPSTGALTFVEQDKDGVDGVDGLEGARGLGVSADGAHLYAAGFIDDAVATFSREGLPVDEGGGSDTDPPETTITKGPRKKTKKRKAKFEFASDEPGSTFECKLDKRDFAPCDPAERFKVKRKKHTLQVRATDPAGNVDPTPAERKWKVKKRK